MALYPSLEDMMVDNMAHAQIKTYNEQVQQPILSAPPPELAGYATAPNAITYPSLHEYMGLELSPAVIAANMPEYAVALPTNNSAATPGNMVAPLSGSSVGLRRAQCTNGVRQLILCKGADQKVGLRVKPIDNGVFVCLVVDGSPAAKAGLRFGDQVLQINGEQVAGYSMEKVHALLKRSPVNGISVVIRDRPFERNITLHKDSAGQVGCQFKNGRITNIVKDSSAARNGLLINQQLLEIQGVNVVGLKDKELSKMIADGGDVITFTIIPSFIYDHMVKKMSGSLLKNMMDHSVLNI